MPWGGPNLGKIACVISVVLPHARLLFVQCDAPLPNQQGAFWSHRWPWFLATSLAPQVGGPLVRTWRRVQCALSVVVRSKLLAFVAPSKTRN